MKEKFEVLWIATHYQESLSRCAIVKRLNGGKEFCCQIAKPIGSKEKQVVLFPCHENFVEKGGMPAMCDISKDFNDLCINDILISQFEL
jgi:hypothetical protein